MHIQQSNISMASQHLASQRYQQHERLESWVGQRPGNAARGPAQDQVSLSQRGRTLAAEAQDKADKSRAVDKSRDAKDEENLPPQLRLIKMAIESLTGQKIRLVNLDNVAIDSQHSESMQQLASLQQQGATDSGGTAGAGFGVDYQYHAEYHETESLDFSASGTVVTADGQQLQFQLDLSLRREFHMQSDTSIQLGDAVQSKDPLVINMDVPAAQLTNQKTDFDIDGDGKSEKVFMLQPGSGFLALDKNNDGKINNGKELFGTQSGNGFADLARFDDDGNNWIDAADAIFKQLKIWSKDDAGKDRLVDLKAANIGAIFLGNAKTDFRHTDAANKTNGDLRSSGVFLKENGQAGSVQQIDLAV